ncbi:MAG TPA: hypothetical protein VGG33_10610, partial [Polyangia bacterium]
MGAPVLAWTDVRSHNADEAWQLDDWLDEACRDGQVPALVLGDLTLVRPLGWAAIPVVAVSTAADDVTFLSRYVGGRCVVPGYLPPQDGRTTDVLCALGKKLAALCGRRVPLVYGSDDQLELIYRQRARFVQDLHLVLNPPALAWALVDKAGFARLCAARDVATPATVVPDEPAAAAREIERLRPPVLVKPRRKSDWKRIQQALFEPSAKAGVFGHARELIAHEAFSRLADVIIVQEYVEAPVANLLSFHGFATDDGEVLGSFVGRKVHTFPAIAGESALLEI